jgi:hypothetical protein
MGDSLDCFGSLSRVVGLPIDIWGNAINLSITTSNTAWGGIERKDKKEWSKNP